MNMRKNLRQPGGSTWSVDDILSPDRYVGGKRGHSLLRLVYLGDGDRVGLRYLLVEDQCVEVRPYEEGDTSPKLSYGLSYGLNERALRESVQQLQFGGSIRRIQVVTAQSLGTMLQRKPEDEHMLRTQIADAMHGAETPGPDQGGGDHKEITPRPEIVVLNVGQGDTILLKLPGKRLWLMDAYFWSKTRYEAFKKQVRKQLGELHLDRLIISHFHYDHIRYGVNVVKDFQPKEVVVADTLIHATAATRNLLAECRSRGALRVLNRTETTRFPGVRVRLTRTADFPGSPALGPDPNEHAIAVAVSTSRARALLPGDIPGSMLAPFVGTRFFAGKASYRLYKVTHHCSNTGDDQQLFDGYQFNDAATSCSTTNRYGHPHDPPESIISMACQQQAGVHAVTCHAKNDLHYVLP